MKVAETMRTSVDAWISPDIDPGSIDPVDQFLTGPFHFTVKVLMLDGSVVWTGPRVVTELECSTAMHCARIFMVHRNFNPCNSNLILFNTVSCHSAISTFARFHF